MKKALRMLAALSMIIVLVLSGMLPLHVVCAEGLMDQNAVQGIAMWPEGASASQAAFLISYSYPQLSPENQADEAINQYYQALAADMDTIAAQWTQSDEKTQIDISCEITHRSQRYISVVQTMTTVGGNGEFETLSADTFARDGIYAGQSLTLSQVLGLEEGTELSTADSVAETLAFDLIWQIVERGMENADGDYLSGLTRQDLQHAFLPETDFYLDEDGNVVFFIQSGEIAGEIAGILRFPFAPSELLSALAEQ